MTSSWTLFDVDTSHRWLNKNWHVCPGCWKNGDTLVFHYTIAISFPRGKSFCFPFQLEKVVSGQVQNQCNEIVIQPKQWMKPLTWPICSQKSVTLKISRLSHITAHWLVAWTILVSCYAKLLQWLSLCYHVSYEPGSIGLLMSKAVSMTTSWQSVWQPYRHTNVKGSQPDNFIVVSLTPHRQSNGTRPSAVMDAVQCTKQILKVKLTGYIVIKNYVQVAFSHIKNKLKL